MLEIFKKHPATLILLIIFTILVCAFLDLQKKAFEAQEVAIEQQRFNKIAQQSKQKGFDNCKEIIDLKQYEPAITCYNQLASKYDDSEIRYYLGWLYAKTNKYSAAVEQYQYVIDNEKENQYLISLAKKELKQAKTTLAELKHLKTHDYGDYYLSLHDCATWEDPKNLSVYIKDKYKTKHIFERAFDEWDNKLFDTVNFTYTDNKEEADISATAMDLAKLRKFIKLDSRNSKIEPDSTIGYTYSHVRCPESCDKKQILTKSTILVSYNDDSGEVRKEDDFYSIALHEIGHSLGIIDHSRHYGDLMYPNTDSVAHQFAIITNRDINTIKKLYGNL